MSDYTRKHVILGLSQTISRLARELKRTVPNHPSWVELTPHQQQVLHYVLAQQDRPVYQRDLEHHFGIRASSVTGLIKPLVEHGFLTRESVVLDGRLKRLQATPQTRAIQSELMEQTETYAWKLCEGLDEAQIQRAQEVLTQMLFNVQQKMTDQQSLF